MNQTSTDMFARVISAIENELTLFENEYANQFNGEVNTLLSNYRPAQGKHLRPILFFLAQGLYRSPETESAHLAVMIELIHDASLVHDDVIDESELRRGHQTLHVANSKHLAVLFGDYLFAQALILGARYGNVRVMELIASAVQIMSKGALREITQILNPDKSVYLKVIKEKTADFFGIVCEIAGIIQNPETKQDMRLRALGENFGMAFQIHDDILDFSGSAETLKKPVNHDLSNGILTLPLIMALDEAGPAVRKEALDYIEDNREDKFEWLQNLIEDTKGLDKAAKIADVYSGRAREILTQFPDSEYKKGLELLMEYEQCRLS